MHSIIARTFLFAACLFMAMANAAEPARKPPLILAVHPYLPRDEIILRFTPLAKYIARSIGQPVEVRVGRDYTEHINAIGTDSVDIAYMGASSYVAMVAKYGKKPLLARQVAGDPPFLKGEIFVRKDSQLRTLADLKGKQFCFGDRHSTEGYILPLAMLERAGVPLSNLAGYTNITGHKNVAMAVLACDCDAGAIKDEVFQEFAPRGLRSLDGLPLVADHVIVASAKLPASLATRLRSAIFKLNELPEGKEIMRSIHSKMTALVSPKDSDYDSLRAIMQAAAPDNAR